MANGFARRLGSRAPAPSSLASATPAAGARDRLVQPNPVAARGVVRVQEVGRTDRQDLFRGHARLRPDAQERAEFRQVDILISIFLFYVSILICHILNLYHF